MDGFLQEVTDHPVRGVEDAAIVARDLGRFVLLGVVAVDEVEVFQQPLVKLGEGVVVELALVAEVGNEAGKRELLPIDLV